MRTRIFATSAQQPAPDGMQPAWISEALQDLYHMRPGERLQLPLDGRLQSLYIAGVWRDYARTFGAVVMTVPAYGAATGDRNATEGSVWLDGRRTADAVAAGLRACQSASSRCLSPDLDAATTRTMQTWSGVQLR